VSSTGPPVCAGQTCPLFASSVQGGTYFWQGPNGFTSTDQNPVLTNIQPSNVGQYCVTVTVAGCQSAPSCVVVSLTTPTTTASNGGPVCIGGTIQLNATSVAGGTYQWNGQGGYTSNLQNPTIPNAQ